MSDENSAILTATGADRPGLLDEMSLFLMERGGKIQDVRVAGLGGHFAFLARVAGPEAALAKIKSDLPTLNSSSQIQAQLHEPKAASSTREGTFPYRLTASGKGQADAMQRIGHLMQVLSINIEDIKTKVHNRTGEGPYPFELDLRLSVPREIPLSMLRDYLKHLCGEMQVEWNLAAL